MIFPRILRIAILATAAAALFGQLQGRVRDRFSSSARSEGRIATNYHVLAPIEPRITDVELALLEKAEALMEANPLYAIAMLEDIVGGAHPSSAIFNHVLANLYFEKGQWDRAEIQYRNAVRKHDRFLRAWNSLGILYYRQDRFGEAAQALIRSIDLGDNDAYTFGLLGYCHLREGNYRASEVAYDMAILKEPRRTEWLEGKAQALAEMGRMAEARFLLDELIAQNPTNPAYWAAQANSWLDLGDYSAAARNLEIARILGQETPEELFLLGGVYLELGMTREAAATYTEAMAMGTIADYRRATQVARLLLNAGIPDDARAIFSRIDASADGWPMADRVNYRVLASDLEVETGNLEGAIEHLIWVSENDPLNGMGLFRLARLYLEADRPAEAQVALDRIRRDSPIRYGAILLQSKILIDQRRYAESLPLIQEALNLRPSAPLNAYFLQVKEAAESVSAFGQAMNQAASAEAMD